MISDLITFLISFFIMAIFMTYYINIVLTREYKEKMTSRVLEISKQQDMLLETATERVSTFIQNDILDEMSTEDPSRGFFANSVQNIMRKAGIHNVSITTFSILCSCGGFAFIAIFVYFKFFDMLINIPAGFLIGAFLVYNIYAIRAANKKMAFLVQFPDAIDMMIRGVKAGLSIGRIMKLVSMEAKDPIASEYRTISQKFDLGIEHEKVLVEAANSLDIEEFRFLVVALVLQMENGGALSEILYNLSTIVRKRLELGLKLKAMSAEARMSAIVLSALPFVFAGIMAVINPAHLKEFIQPGSGQTLLKVAISLFAIGTFIMVKATKIKV